MLGPAVATAPGPVAPAPTYAEVDQTVVRPRAARPPEPVTQSVPVAQPEQVAQPGEVAQPAQVAQPEPWEQQGYQPPPQQWAAPPAPAPWQQAPAQRPPRAVPTVNPFAITPVSDYVKDAVSAVCLLTAIALPWDFSGDANDTWWAVLSLLIALFGLGLPYLMASRVLPAFAPVHVLVAKLGLALPLVVSTLIAVVMDLVTIGDANPFFGVSSDGGLGIAIALGLAGAGLMVQPRAVEEQTGRLAEGAWRAAATASAIGAVVLGVLAFVAYVLSLAVDDSLGFFGAVFWVALAATALLTPLVGAGIPAVFLLRGSAGGRRAFAVVAWTVVVVTMLATGDNDAFSSTGYVPGVDSWFGPVGGTFLMGLAAALLLSRPAVRRTTHADVHPVSAWLETARLALLISTALLVINAITLVVLMVAAEEFPGLVIVLVLALIAAAVASGVGVSLVRDLRQRVVATVAASVVVVLGIVVWIVSASADTMDVGFAVGLGPWDAVMLFTLPALALWALWVPAPVRAALPPRPQQQPWAQPPAGWTPPPAGWTPPPSSPSAPPQPSSPSAPPQPSAQWAPAPDQ